VAGSARAGRHRGDRCYRASRHPYLLAPSLTRILRDLEARRLIRRRRDPSDRRAALIALSGAGRRTLAVVDKESEATDALIEARLGRSRSMRG